MATAADIGCNIADLVFLPDSLEAVSLAIDVSERAGRLIRQNIGLAIVYNVIAIPVVVPGHVTPLNTVIAMFGRRRGVSVLVYLIPAALLLGAADLAAFLWALKSDQYEDLDGAGERILIDSEPPDASKDRKPAEPDKPAARRVDGAGFVVMASRTTAARRSITAHHPSRRDRPRFPDARSASHLDG
jgi:cbb3-type cytochrome oxidase maturation protein